jgi:hypothetical protein
MNTIMKIDRSGIGYLTNQERRLKLNNNKASRSPSQRDVLSVDKKVILLMSAKLYHHNPCSSMLDHLLSMLITCLEKIQVER